MSVNILCLSGLMLMHAGCKESAPSGVLNSYQTDPADQVTDYINFRSFQNPDKTWGFTVFINGKPFRHYNNIPYKNLKSGFISEMEAEKVAELFIGMIRDGNSSPKLDKRLIDSMRLTIDKKRKSSI